MNTPSALVGDASHERPPRRSVGWADEDNQRRLIHRDAETEGRVRKRLNPDDQ